ncbi:MAG: putative membrane protein YfcA [Alteromonadaceae bacterium]|jgi:uncharacterized membrane protein YfcA
MTIELITLFSMLGIFVGLMSGLFGIGGGGIMVPLFASIFISYGIAIENPVHIALGTSMTAIIFTSLSSAWAHHKYHNVSWLIVKKMTIGIALGAFLATFVAATINSLYLAIFFTAFMFYVAIKMFISSSPNPLKVLPSDRRLFIAGYGIGTISSLVSIGGGSLMVPFLINRNIDIKKAIGTSAAVGFPLSLAGSIGFLLNDSSAIANSAQIYGFVHLPAAITVSIFTVIFAPLGAKLSTKLPLTLLKKLFALLLTLLSIKMLLLVLTQTN